MAEGTLTVYLGPMFSKKSTALLEHAEGLPKDYYCLIKPTLDNRYSDNEVVTHDGVRLSCLSLSGPVDLPASVETVLIDEIQFFGADLIPWVRGLLHRGIDVIAAGLDMNWRGEPFMVSGALAAMADRVEKRHAHCAVCGEVARKTKKVGGSNDTIELGAANIYESRCNIHWSS